MFGFHPNGIIARILKRYYSVEASEEFFECASTQLVNEFLQITKLDTIPKGIRLGWEQENPFEYAKGDISKIKPTLWLKYGWLTVTVCWQSQSGRIYDISDIDIDCNDIKFWFEDFDFRLCLHYISPLKWSLITFPEQYISYTKNQVGIDTTISFIKCMDNQLSAYFQTSTGISINKEICLQIAYDFTSYNIQTARYEKGSISKLTTCLYVNHNWNYLMVAWDSPSGKIYAPDDEITDYTDIRFWFEGFDGLLYQKQMYPKLELPFKLKNLSYELEVNHLGVHATILLHALPGNENLLVEFSDKISDFIEDFNTQSEKKDRNYGVVHNHSIFVENNTVTLELDSGSAGAKFYKSLLLLFSDSTLFNKVVMS